MDLPAKTAHFVVALGSNRAGRSGAPADAIRAALAMIGGVITASPIISTAPLGPSIRRFANAVAIIASAESPPELLARLKAIERRLGRRPGRRWGARVIDLDIILWSNGAWADRRLIVPHRAFRERGFVIAPLMQIAPNWRDPVTGLRIRHLAHRLSG